MKTFILTIALILFNLSLLFSQSSAFQKNHIELEINKEDGMVLLLWNTYMETNSSYFLVERSIDGTHYETIGRVKASSTTYQKTDYEFEDLYNKSGNESYRITLVMMDGSTISQIANLKGDINLAKAVAR